MKEFVFGTAAQFDWLEALLADGRCHVFEHCVLPPGCTPGTARLGFEKNSSVYILYIDYGIKTTVQDAKFCSLLEQGEVRFVCMQDMVEFLYALQPLFGAAAPSAGAEPDRAQATPPVAEETPSEDDVVDMAAVLEQREKELREQGQVQAAEEYAQLWRIFCDVLDQFVELLGDTEVEGEEFARLLRLTLSQYAVATIPATLDQVKVSPLNRNDRHTVAHLFLLGANDHVLPTVEKPGGILDQQERELLQQQGILLSDATFDPLSNELQNIYAALAQPRTSLTVSWCVGDESGARLLPSFVVERIKNGYEFLLPYYDYFLTLPSDPEPETLK